MPIQQFVSDSLYFRRNDEAIEEFAKLGFQLPENMARVLKVVDNRRTFRQVMAHPSIEIDETAGEAIRSLIKLGMLEAVPVVNMTTGPQPPAHPSITSTQRMRVISSNSDIRSIRRGMAARNGAARACGY
jgi:hypothetical protein